MDLNTAFTTVRRMKAEYQAFEQMEEVIAAAVAAEASITSLAQRQAALSIEVADLGAQAIRAKGEAEQASADASAAIDKEQTRARVEIALLVGEASEARRRHDTELAGLAEALTRAREDADAQTRDLKDSVFELTKERDAMQNALDALKRRAGAL